MDYASLASKLLQRQATVMRATMQRQVDEYSKGEMFILNYLVDENRSVRPSELSSAMNTSSARIAAALNSLERKGLIIRQTDESDRRRILVTITQRGERNVLRKREEIRTHVERVLRELGEDDAREYVRIVGRIAKIINGIQSSQT